MPADRMLSVRLTPEGRRRLQTLAKARGVTLSRCVRQLVDEASPDAPPPPRRRLTETDLLNLMRERAEDGNVAAIRSLLEMERNSDPRQAALTALQQMAEGRRQ